VTDPAEIAGVESILRIALQEERFNFDPLLSSVRRKTKTRSSEIDFPTRITIENKSHPTCTLIEVETSDRLGLLYDLVSCLGRNNVYITLSRINTEKGAAIDTFYVADAATRTKITDAKRIEQLQQELHEATRAPA
jgi:[protein-PII] uridylyltransferase